jgi:hypothetical protein
MSNIQSPLTGSAPPPARNLRYDWAAAADGEFHQWRDSTDPTETVTESRRAYHRIRISAHEWAARRGGTITSRIVDNGRQVWIAIHLPGGE